MMKKKTFIFLISTSVVLLISALLLKLNLFKFEEISKLPVIVYALFALSLFCLGGLMAFGLSIISQYRKKLTYRIIVITLGVTIVVSIGLMLFGSVLMGVYINPDQLFLPAVETYTTGEDLVSFGIELFILMFFVAGIFIGVYESLIEDK